MSRVAIYPGSFDPLTCGHISIIERGLRIFDKIIVGIAINIQKSPLLTIEERMSLIRESFPDTDRVEIDTFQGLLVEYAKHRQCSVVLRGLRAVSDFEYELQMANMNRKLDDSIETVFMMTEESHFYVSSRLVKEVARFGGSVTGLVPEHVEAKLLEKFGKEQ
jgi:pantetheine-phosphate adenylyltransferase